MNEFEEVPNQLLDEIVVYPTRQELSDMAVNRALHATLPNFNFMRAVNLSMPIRRQLTRRAKGILAGNEEILDMFGYLRYPYNCINTATSWINPSFNTISSNAELKRNPTKYNFTSTTAPIPGSLVQLATNGNPYHAGVVTRVDPNTKEVYVRSSTGIDWLNEEKAWRYNDENNQLHTLDGDDLLFYNYTPDHLGKYRIHNGKEIPIGGNK